MQKDPRENLILSILCRGKATRTGIMERYAKTTGKLLPIGEIDALLKKLASKELVATELGEIVYGENGKLTYFCVTDKGRDKVVAHNRTLRVPAGEGGDSA